MTRRSRTGRSTRWLAVVAAMLLATHVQAHTRSQSFSDWQIDGPRITGTFTIDARRATLLYADGPAGHPLAMRLADHLADTVRITQAADCTAQRPQPLASAPGYLRVGLAFDCPQPAAQADTTLTVAALFRLAATHVHVARIRDDDGTREAVLSPQRPAVAVGHGAPSSAAATVIDFTWLGTTHVLAGWDHLAFVGALMLLAPTLGLLLLTLSGFTIGHCLTLALAATGVLAPSAGGIEALIAFSIVFAALAAAHRRGWIGDAPIHGLAWATLLIGSLAAASGRLAVWPGLVVACALMLPAATRGAWHRTWAGPLIGVGFGLAHGAGFAGALAPLIADAPALLPALLGFNLGVELGQIAVVAAVLALAGTVRHVPSAAPLIARAAPVAPALLVGIGTYWWATRSLTLG